MAFSTQRAVSDGSLVLLDIELDYFSRDEMLVFFDGVPTETGWAWVGSTDKKISFSPAVSDGVEVMVVRSTDFSEVRHVFTHGAQFTADSLDQNMRQLLHIIQEARENATIEEVFHNLNLHGFKITGLGNGTAPTDGVNVSQLETHNTTIIGYRDQTQGYRNEALGFRNDAESFANSLNASLLAQKDGSNATGTWGISITGNAATATSAGTATTATTAVTAAVATTVVDGAVSSSAKVANAVISPEKLTQQPGESSGTLTGLTVKESGSIPAWATEITVVFDDVSTVAADRMRVQLMDSVYATTGYLSAAGTQTGEEVLNTGFALTQSGVHPAYPFTGVLTVRRLSPSSNRWVYSSVGTYASVVAYGAGAVTLSGGLTQLRLNLVGASSFDSGTVSFKYR